MLETPVRNLPSLHAIPHPIGGRTSLYLVRHGRTLGNVNRMLCGWTDVPLDRYGIHQAERVAARLAEGMSADVLLASPLQRARVTAEIIGAKLGLTPIIRDD